ncbi:MAG: hypothetical protein MUD12_05105 [Spirochaetes bacterium]|jgi:hypothetical protein|nr:hypothetical protein [Spirochaetota bacterium]
MSTKKIFILLVAVLISSSILFSCKKDNWAAKIDDDVISLDDFYNYYYLQNKLFLNLEKKDLDKLSGDPTMMNHPTINKARFLDFIISRKILYKKAMDDKNINKDDLNTIVELSKLQAVSTFYIMERLKNEIKVTDQEAEQFYNSNKKLFNNVPIDENIINRIKQQIFMQKIEERSNEFIMDMMAQYKINREGLKNHLKEKSAEKEKKEQDKPEKGKK